MKISVVCVSDICGIDESFFYGLGIELFMFIKTNSRLDNIRAAIKSAFESSDGVCVLYSQSSWPNIQKTMLMEFERSSVFVEAKKPYVIANGFKEFETGIFFDNIYDKPFMIIPNDIKENFSNLSVFDVFKPSIKRIGVFNESIDSKYTHYKDEAETVMIASDADFEDAVSFVGDRKNIYTTQGESPQQALYRILKNKRVTISTAESCTAGLISAFIADVPGISKYLKGGCVTYSNEMKMRFLGVNLNSLNTVGAVSREVALQMAIGVRNNSSSDFSVAVTGIAGPSGATKDKPVGLVYIAVASRFGADVKEIVFKGNRRLIRHKTTKFAILFLRDFITRQ